MPFFIEGEFSSKYLQICREFENTFHHQKFGGDFDQDCQNPTIMCQAGLWCYVCSGWCHPGESDRSSGQEKCNYLVFPQST